MRENLIPLKISEDIGCNLLAECRFICPHVGVVLIGQFDGPSRGGAEVDQQNDLAVRMRHETRSISNPVDSDRQSGFFLDFPSQTVFRQLAEIDFPTRTFPRSATGVGSGALND